MHIVHIPLNASSLSHQQDEQEAFPLSFSPESPPVLPAEPDPLPVTNPGTAMLDSITLR